MKNKFKNFLTRQKQPNSRDINEYLKDPQVLSSLILNEAYRAFHFVGDLPDNFKRLKRRPTQRISDTNEKAYQRAIFSAGKAIVLDDEVEWLDYEIPVLFNGNGRAPCFDLIGRFTDDHSTDYVLVELKKVDGQSPICMMYELVKYYMGIQRNQGCMYYHDFERGDYWDSIKRCKFLVGAAPEAYWQHWENKMNDLYEVAESLTSSLADQPSIVFCSFPETDFIAQRNGATKYIPQIEREVIFTRVG